MHGEFTPNNISKKEKKERKENKSSGCVQFMKGHSPDRSHCFGPLCAEVGCQMSSHVNIIRHLNI